MERTRRGVWNRNYWDEKLFGENIIQVIPTFSFQGTLIRCATQWCLTLKLFGETQSEKKKKKKSLPVFFFLLEKASYKALVSVSGLVLSPFPFFLCTAFRTKVKSYFERPLFNFPSLGGTILLGKHEEQSCLSALVLSLVDKLYSIVNNSAPGSDHELLTIL